MWFIEISQSINNNAHVIKYIHIPKIAHFCEYIKLYEFITELLNA